jgi:hypothetical protein
MKHKGQPGEDERHPEQEHRIARQVTLRDGEHDGLEVRASAHAVDDRHAVEKEADRECTNDKVLERRLVAEKVTAAKRHEHVDRETHELDTQKDRYQVVGGNQHDHAHGREEQHGEELAAVETEPSKIRRGHQHRAECRNRHHDREEKRVAVDDQHAVQDRLAFAAPQLDHVRKHERVERDDEHTLQRADAICHRARYHEQEPAHQQHDHGRELRHDAHVDHRLVHRSPSSSSSVSSLSSVSRCSPVTIS